MLNVQYLKLDSELLLLRKTVASISDTSERIENEVNYLRDIIESLEEKIQELVLENKSLKNIE